MTQATVSLSSAESEAKAQRLGPGRRAKHLEVQTMWVQQLNKLSLISMKKLGALENVADMMTKHSGQIGRNDGLLIPR